MHTKFLALFMLVLCSGCSKAEISDARISHLMARDHGWIDLTVKTPQPSTTPSGAHDCGVSVAVNGETLLRESANFIDADRKGSPVGYRFPAPAGKLDVELIYSLCLAQPFVIKQSLNLPKDHLAKLTFDGRSLAFDGDSPYNPSSLESLHAQLEDMRRGAADADHRMSTMSALVLLCLALNVLVLCLLMLRRRAP
ncbi:MAG: hypothetical protein V4582_04470 [Pseudomonadota bacterium]